MAYGTRAGAPGGWGRGAGCPAQDECTGHPAHAAHGTVEPAGAGRVSRVPSTGRLAAPAAARAPLLSMTPTHDGVTAITWHCGRRHAALRGSCAAAPASRRRLTPGPLVRAPRGTWLRHRFFYRGGPDPALSKFGREARFMEMALACRTGDDVSSLSPSLCCIGSPGKATRGRALSGPLRDAATRGTGFGASEHGVSREHGIRRPPGGAYWHGRRRGVAWIASASMPSGLLTRRPAG